MIDIEKFLGIDECEDHQELNLGKDMAYRHVKNNGRRKKLI